MKSIIGKLKRFYFRTMPRLMMSSDVCMYVCMWAQTSNEN